MSANEDYDDLDDLLGDVEVKASPSAEPSANEKSATVPKVADPVANSDEPQIKAGDANVTEDESKLANIASLSLEDQDDAFANQLQEGVDELLKETEGDPEAQKLIESLLGSLRQQPAQDDAKASQSSAGSQKATAPPSFEDTISATMDRLHESQQQSSEDLGGNDFMERMLRELQNGASSLDGEGGLDDLLSNMMSELSSKEVLYEPMKDMHTKYPEWLATKGQEVSADELKRYKQQQSIVAEIVEVYEAPDYSDGNKETRAFITAKMEEMQDTGAPPDELVGDVAGGSFLGGMPTTGGTGVPPMPSECATQ